MRITESQLRKIIREELVGNDPQSWVAASKADIRMQKKYYKALSTAEDALQVIIQIIDDIHKRYPYMPDSAHAFGSDNVNLRHLKRVIAYERGIEYDAANPTIHDYPIGGGMFNLPGPAQSKL